MGLGQPFFGAVAGHWKDLAERYDFDLKIYDGKFDAGTVQTLVDDIIADKPDGVAFAPLSADAAVPQVEKFQAAGIPVVTYNIQPAEPVAPRVIGFDYQSLLITGCNAGAYYNAKFGDTPAKIGIVHYSVLPQVQDRANGFLKGFLSQVPTAEVVAVVEGGAVIDKALPAASDLLQKNPEVNVLFGINNDSTLGIIGALKADNKYSSDWGVTASIDGSLPAVTELMNPDSPWKAESGYPPYDYAIQTFNLLGADPRGQGGQGHADCARPAAHPADHGSRQTSGSTPSIRSDDRRVERPGRPADRSRAADRDHRHLEAVPGRPGTRRRQRRHQGR